MSSIPKKCIVDLKDKLFTSDNKLKSNLTMISKYTYILMYYIYNDGDNVELQLVHYGTHILTVHLVHKNFERNNGYEIAGLKIEGGYSATDRDAINSLLYLFNYFKQKAMIENNYLHLKNFFD